MREIKFRAWNKKKEIFIPAKIEDEDGDECGNCIGLEGNIISYENIPYYPSIGYDRFEGKDGQWIDEKDIILMQFTGLKDKNGKEIYEGDIVDGRYGKRLVEWDDNNSGFRPFNEVINAPDAEIESEVIGNIYENKELLK